MSAAPPGVVPVEHLPPEPVPAAPVLAIRGLSLVFPSYRGPVQALSDVSIELAPGEIVALVGESGSGKSVTAMAAIRLLPPTLYRVTGGSIAVVGQDVMALPPAGLARLRGKSVSMVFQEPRSALNPTIRIGRQIVEVLRRHQSMSRATAAVRAMALLADMQVSDPARVMAGYAFELSGGMRQRVLLAMAFACNPQLLIADEPTTALDVTVQAQVLSLIRTRARAHGTAVLFISHDLAVVSQLCTRIYVMYAGQIVERGASEEVLTRPLHPYTHALLRSLPDAAVPGTPLRSIAGTVPGLLDPPSGCRFRARCEHARERCTEPPRFAHGHDRLVRDAACWFPLATPVERRSAAAGSAAPSSSPDRAPLVQIRAAAKRFALTRNWRGQPELEVHALNGVDLDILRGETLAVVGESGCGKSTLAQLVMALEAPTAGQVCFDGADLATLSSDELRRVRRRFQMVFQDPQASLDPRMPAWRLISEPLSVAGEASVRELRRRAGELASLVGIRAEQLDRYAHEFSGGQRQRIAIARALALEPQLLVLDEPTSALDVSIQAQILNLLMELQSRLRLTYLFISHNVAVVRHVAERVAVMYLGQIVELGPCGPTVDRPVHPYTRQLFGAVPRLSEPFIVPPPSPVESRSNIQLPEGCFFRARCGWADDACAAPQTLRALGGRHVRCHRAEAIERAPAMERAAVIEGVHEP